jgi:hypothetical protein
MAGESVLKLSFEKFSSSHYSVDIKYQDEWRAPAHDQGSWVYKYPKSSQVEDPITFLIWI